MGERTRLVTAGRGVAPRPVPHAIAVERRRALRAPVRGTAVVHADASALHGALENLSRDGALVRLTRDPAAHAVRGLEVRLAGGGHGRIPARAVRVERSAAGFALALAFDRVEPAVEAAIDAAVAVAVSAARLRSVLVVDDRPDRRARLVARLAARGMMPLTPRAPLEAFDLLSSPRLHIGLGLLARGFGVPAGDLAAVLAESFPDLVTDEIGDDAEATAERAAALWIETPIARVLASAERPVLAAASAAAAAL